MQEDILDKLSTLPDSLLVATNVVQDSHTKYLATSEASKREVDELRKINTDLQVQLTKARGAHGQIRVEKDVLSEKLSAVDADREHLRNQIKDVQAANTATAEHIANLERRNVELQGALANALSGLQTSDVAKQANQERINDLEKANRDIDNEKQSLKLKVGRQ